MRSLLRYRLKRLVEAIGCSVKLPGVNASTFGGRDAFCIIKILSLQLVAQNQTSFILLFTR